MLRMDEINKIKKTYNTQDKSINEISKKFNRSWGTTKKYIDATSEKLDQRGLRKRKCLVITDEVTNRITQLIQDEISKNVPRKQRYTACYIYKLLKKEGIYKGSERQLRKSVSLIREGQHQLKKKNNSYLELDFEHGHYLQLDHGEATIVLNNIEVIGYLFTASAPGLVIRYCQFYLTKDGLSWADFHERAFKYYGGIFENCIYDNDTALVVPSTREFTKVFNDIVGHYDFKVILCNKASGWEKGGVENSVGYCRRNFLAGIPEFESLDAINIHLADKSKEDVNTVNHYQTGEPLSVGLEILKEKLNNLKPAHLWCISETVSVNSQQMIKYKNYGYSVPEKFVSFWLKINISIKEIFIYEKDDTLIQIHQRIYQGDEDSQLIEHYYDQLERKPNAFEFAKVVKKQQFSNDLKLLRERLFLIREKLSNHPNSEFIRILTLQRNATIEEFESSIKLSLSYGGITYDAIKSMINLLQIEQQPMSYSISKLPAEYQVNIDQEFNLEVYNELY
jgi:transposase